MDLLFQVIDPILNISQLWNQIHLGRAIVKRWISVYGNGKFGPEMMQRKCYAVGRFWDSRSALTPKILQPGSTRSKLREWFPIPNFNQKS